MRTSKSMILPRATAALAVVLAVAFASSHTIGQTQQKGVTTYVYDKNGRLESVVMPTGEKIDYEYDAAGNVLVVRRTIALVGLFSFSPREGGAGDRITFMGFGFGPGLADNTVFFNGVAAQIVSSSPNQIVAVVPDNATIGPITVTTPNGSMMTEPFIVLPRLRVEPSSAILLSGQSKQFRTVFTAFAGDKSVIWSVNGVEGGDGDVGTISKTGLYTAPVLLPLKPQVKIRAASAAMPTLFGEADALLLEKLQFAALASTVSVRRGFAVDESTLIKSSTVSVRRGLGLGESATASSAAVSVRNGFNEPFPSLSSAVSVRLGLGLDKPTPTISSIVSVRLGLGIDPAAPAFSSIVSVTNGPNISSIAPGALKQGATAQLTITGTNLNAATSVNFINADGAINAGVVASNLSINAEGTQLTATITVGSTTALGKRTVVVSTQTASSQTAIIGSNTVEIIAP